MKFFLNHLRKRFADRDMDIPPHGPALLSKSVREGCLGSAERYELSFLEMGTERHHRHFLLQSVPRYSPTKLVQTVKSLTARQVFVRAPEGKKQLWGGEVWGEGYCVTTVGQQGNEHVSATYIRKQGQAQDDKQLHKQPLQLELFS